MRWFWDAQHYKTSFGDLIQDRMSNLSVSSEGLPDGYGVSIDAKNIDVHLLAVRERQKEYRRSHPGNVAEIERRVAITLKAMGLRLPN
jgi:hypothetical protein